MIGSDFADTFVATGFNATSANAGSNGAINLFEGRAGDDFITGNGSTQVSYRSATSAVTVNIGLGTASGDLSVGTDSFSGVNSVLGSGFGDTLTGSDANDQFNGGAGNDTISGGLGVDRAAYFSFVDDTVTGGVTINMAAGTVAGDASVGADTLTSVETIRGSNFADIYLATGFSGASANAGSNGTFNEFEGMGGDDTVTGNGNTRIVFLNATAGVTVDLANAGANGQPGPPRAMRRLATTSSRAASAQSSGRSSAIRCAAPTMRPARPSSSTVVMVTTRSTAAAASIRRPTIPIRR